MFNYVLSFILVVLEVLCCRIFFETFGVKRTRNKNLADNGIILLLVVFIYITAIFLSNIFILKQGFIVLAETVCMMLYIAIGVKKSLTLSVLFQGLLLAVDYFMLLLNIFVFNNIVEMSNQHPVQASLFVVLGKVILFLIILMIRRYMGKDSMAMLIESEWLRFLIFPIFTICTISAVIITSSDIEQQSFDKIYYVIAVGLAVINMTVFYLIKDLLKRELEVHKNKISEMHIRNQLSMHHSVMENFEKQQKKTHEYKNQIMCIEFLIKNKNYEELEEYVQTISGDLDDTMDSIHTNNIIVDAILNSKYQEMLKKNIVLVLRINDLSDIPVKDEDIVVLLSNLLNNAVEACERCSGKKIIKLKFMTEDDILILSVRNTYEHDVIIQNGQIRTTKKENIEEHGIGIGNIIDIVQKYDGYYSIKEESKEFYFSIVIPGMD